MSKPKKNGLSDNAQFLLMLPLLPLLFILTPLVVIGSGIAKLVLGNDVANGRLYKRPSLFLSLIFGTVILTVIGGIVLMASS